MAFIETNTIRHGMSAYLQITKLIIHNVPAVVVFRKGI